MRVDAGFFTVSVVSVFFVAKNAYWVPIRWVCGRVTARRGDREVRRDLARGAKRAESIYIIILI